MRAVIAESEAETTAGSDAAETTREQDRRD
jgi:hypothetical protein